MTEALRDEIMRDSVHDLPIATRPESAAPALSQIFIVLSISTPEGYYYT